jgi:hypothetical protein
MMWREDEFHRHLRFDEFLMLGAEETAAAVDLLAPALDAKRLRARKTSEADAFNRTIGLVVANALVGGERGAHYSRRLETYSGRSPYRPAWLGSKRLLGVVDGLAEAGFVDATDGRWAGVFADGKGEESSFTASPALVQELAGLGIDLHAVQRDRASAAVIVLKDEGDRLIRYDPADDRVARQIEELRDYNALVAAQQITRCGADTPRFGDLTRFYKGGWDQGGRHFGGWWQRIGSEKRSDILINGKETIELDFGGFFPRALYHLTGQESPGDDPYDIPDIRHLMENHGIDWDSKGRKAVKTMVSIAISAKSKNAFLGEKSKGKIALPGDLITSCVPKIIDYHSPIKDHLLKGKALDLMNAESDICHGVIIRGLNDGVVVLPIFDSFVTTKGEEEYLRGLMVDEYAKRLGNKPTIH